jgi:hypothetical protein
VCSSDLPITALFGAVAALALVAAAAGAEAYRRDADFAARVNAMASDTQTRANEIIASFR